jgi:S-adenosylmethionine/arginine decarboxylase-like enzyme
MAHVSHRCRRLIQLDLGIYPLPGIKTLSLRQCFGLQLFIRFIVIFSGQKMVQITADAPSTLATAGPVQPSYRPGLHILASFSAHAGALNDMEACRFFFDRLIEDKALVKVGAAYHAFPGGGFTAVIALTESHLSIHTWPEYGLATFDVFLSNFLRDNEHIVRSVYAETLRFFNATEQNKTEVHR